ncbi:MAG: hypothetical protein ACTSRC_20825 [Candidatus Helarchaeota archaeon]
MSQFFGEKLYRIGKAAQQLGVSIQTLRNWIYSGKIRNWIYSEKEVKITKVWEFIHFY